MPVVGNGRRREAAPRQPSRESAPLRPLRDDRACRRGKPWLFAQAGCALQCGRAEPDAHRGGAHRARAARRQRAAVQRVKEHQRMRALSLCGTWRLFRCRHRAAADQRLRVRGGFLDEVSDELLACARGAMPPPTSEKRRSCRTIRTRRCTCIFRLA